MEAKRTLWFWILSAGYIVAGVSLFFFSYTQVDLSLTLSSASIFQFIEKTFQHVGFYARPTATVWYIAVVFTYFLLYGSALVAFGKKQLDLRSLWILIALTTIILVLSYPAFSYDIFNYMFTAKTVLVYHKNPYQVIPLQFTGVEPWLSFMRWTHLPSAYTPLWILITLPAYTLGFGYFLWTLWNFKILAALFYVLTIRFMVKILKIQDSKNVALGVAIFALNPLIIFETLVSGHNDIAMMALAVMSIYYFAVKQKTLSYLLLALSVGTKLMTIFLYPVIILGYRKVWAFIAMCLGLILVLFQREVLPWYLVWIMPFAGLIPTSNFLILVTGGASIGLLLRYAPYFYYGNWNSPVPTIELWVTVVPIVIGVLGYLCLFIVRRKSGS